MTITATKTYSPTPAITSFESFAFDDGATVRVSGGLVCSQHGRRHCCHHKLAHEAIVTAAAQKAAAPVDERAATIAHFQAAERQNANKDPFAAFDAEIAYHSAREDRRTPDEIDVDLHARYLELQAAAEAEEAAELAAIEAADAFNADYDAWLDSLPASQPLPQDVGLNPDDYASDQPDWLESAEVDESDDSDACDGEDTPFFSSRS